MLDSEIVLGFIINLAKIFPEKYLVRKTCWDWN